MIDSDKNIEQRWRIILNPASGRGEGARRRSDIEQLFEKHAPAGAGWWLTETSRSGDARKLAIAALEAGFHGIAVAGGDGTLGEAIDGVLSRTVGPRTDNSRDSPPPRFAVLPLGTGNDFARCVGVGTNLELGVKTVFHGTARTIDAGRALIADREHYFINVAGCGFDAVVAERINRGFRRLNGTPAYLAAVLSTLRKYRATTLRISADERQHEIKAMLGAVANATSYGGGMLVAPDAVLDDGLLDLCVVGDATKLDFLRTFPQVFKGTHVTHPKVTMLRARRIQIDTDEPLTVLADGEIIGTTPAEFEVVPGAIVMMVPQNTYIRASGSAPD